MKSNKMVYLDVEIIEKLNQEDNFSALINFLLTNHYSNKTKSNPQDIDNKLKDINKEYNELMIKKKQIEEELELKARKEEEEEYSRQQAYELEKQEAKLRHELKKKYTLETPLDLQSKTHFEEWLTKQ
jgi:hypothetical protein